jgi:uncharacterized repeat protein (TIGR03803 family)
MKNNLSRIPILALAAIVFTFGTFASAQYTLTDLHNFGSENDGVSAEAAPVIDSSGNLFGVTAFGGTIGGGMAYELSPSSTGWTYAALYNFPLTRSTDASGPNGSLILDTQGNLYGVSHFGGTSNRGTVFEISPSFTGWTESVLYSFAGSTSDGEEPSGSLIFDSSGNLYGTTPLGGAHDSGTVFELTPSSSGWTEQIIYSFTGKSDGAGPGGNLLIDSTGRIYGMAALGGAVNSQCCGTIFRLTNASGSWRFDLIFNFRGNTGGSAPDAIVFDSAGNIYGTADFGGTGCTTTIGCGVVFKLTPSASGGPWKEKILHAFNKQEGEYPSGAAFDFKGNLYGTCSGGASLNEGNVWELTPTASGPWIFTSLFVFGEASDGYEDNSGVIVDPKGNLYGGTTNGGAIGGGTIFELSPPASN